MISAANGTGLFDDLTRHGFPIDAVDSQVIKLRVKALERRSASVQSGSADALKVERSAKKAKAENPEPPSTIRRLLSSVLPGLSKTPCVISPSQEQIGLTQETQAAETDKLLSPLLGARSDQPEITTMTQISGSTVASRGSLPKTRPEPAISSATAKVRPVPLLAMTASSSSGSSDPPCPPSRPPESVPSLRTITRPRNTAIRPAMPPSTLALGSLSLPNSILSSSSSHSSTPPTRSLYPPLNPPYTERTTAIARLFPNNSTSTPANTANNPPPAPIAIPMRKDLKESPNVRGLVRSFEDAGVLKGFLEREKDGLRRSRSSAGLRSLL